MLAFALLAIQVFPIQALADNENVVQEDAGGKTLPYPLANYAVPASAMEYDSIAQCFVVRDTIFDPRTRSASGAKVVTRAASTYTEKGVIYGYFGNQLSSKSMGEMQQLVEPWIAKFWNLDVDKLLAPEPDKETWYMQIVGVDNDDLDDLNGEMRIYNNIGEIWNYKTVSIDSLALRGNEHIKSVVFEDCFAALSNAHNMLNMVIHDGAFKDCKNLKTFNMFYLVTEGENYIKLLHPSDVYVGKKVFDGCHEDFRIQVAPQLYDEFVSDPNWSQYADKIVALDYLPTVYNPITHEGVVYDYAAKTLNSLPTSELTRLQSSWWNAAIIGVEVAAALVTYGTTSGLIASKQQLAAQLVSQGVYQDVAKEMVEQMIKESAVQLVDEIGGELVNLVRSEAMRIFMERAATTRLAAIGVGIGSAAATNGLDYLANTMAYKASREPSWALHGGQWLMTENKHTIYHMYVKDAPNQETVTLYNDIGSAYNYATVAIGAEAFAGKDSIKTIKFKDVNTGEMYEDMLVVLPDQVFKNCTSLEKLDLIMWSNYTDREIPLGPENFILCGDDLFAGCDMSKLKIRIGKEKYEDFVNNEAWKKYKDNFEVVDVPEKADHSVYGAQYSYSFENNSLKMQEYPQGHTIEHVHVIGPDASSLTKQGGELGLFNDIGQYNNYKLDYVKHSAFKGNETLKGISMFDLKGLAGFGDSYTELSFMLNDSAFANCPNLEYINMLYFRTDGKNSVEPMSPGRVQLGKDVFAGSDKFKVKMVTTAVDAFKADSAWAQYEDRFLPSLIITEDAALAEVLEDAGLQYESPVTGGSFDVYDVMQGNINDKEGFLSKFAYQNFISFREFKAFEHINFTATIPDMFRECKKLQSIELPSTLTKIDRTTFQLCESLDDIVIPASVTEILDGAFYGCSRLKSITFLSETPATLGTDVFFQIPNDYVIYVPESAVEAYKTAWVEEYASHIQSVSNKQTGIFEVTLTEAGTLANKLGLETVGNDPLVIDGNFSKYDSLKISGPINSTDIGVIRFLGGRDVDNCEKLVAGNLKYLDLYDADIKAGGEDYNQDGANDLITEDNSVGTYMFWELDKLETLILPKSATKVMQSAFENCDNLRRLVIGDNTNSIGKNVTKDCAKLKEVILLCNEAPATDKNAWDENYHIETFYAPNAYGVHLMGSHAYYTRAYVVVSPFEDDAVMRALAQKRIYTTDDLAKVTSADNLITGNAEVKFFNELLYAEGIKNLGDNVFGGCSNLEKVTLSGALETISAGAFSGCTSLTAVNVISDTIPGLAADAFKDLPQEFVIYVAPGKEDAYRKAWSQYADHIQGLREKKESEIKVVHVAIPGTLGEKLGFTVNMDTENNVGRISGDFTSIKALKVIGSINGKDIAVLRMLGGREEEDADEVIFARMNYLDLYEATICTDHYDICFNRDGQNDYVKNDNEVPEHMFWKLDMLETVILPKNATKIADNAFYDCLNLQTIVVGDATTEIGDNAFGKCKKLKNIVFLCNEKPVLDDDAFTDPISDQPHQVEKMYVASGIYNNYLVDNEYTSHAKEVRAEYADDALFRVYGSHVIMNNDQLSEVTNIDGWFDIHNGVKDLSSLKQSAIDTVKATTFASLTGLQKIALPATLAQMADNVFATNTKLLWADFAQVNAKDVITESKLSQLGINEYALVYAPDSLVVEGDLKNVVYNEDGKLKCGYLALSDNADFAAPRAFKAATISYDRQFEQGVKTTLSLPFNMVVPAGAKAYQFVGDFNDAVLIKPVDVMEANQPYVVVVDKNMSLSTNVETEVLAVPNHMPKVETTNYAVSSTLAAISGAYAKQQHMYLLGADNSWTEADTDDTILPYRVYIQARIGGMPEILMYEAIDEMTIADGTMTEFVNLEEKYVGDLTYTRNINNSWNALYLPFQLELTDDFLANYDVATIDDVLGYDNNQDGELDAWEVIIIKVKDLEMLEANHPYVIRPKNEEAMSLVIKQNGTILYSTLPEKQHMVAGESAHVKYMIKGVYAKTQSQNLEDGNYVYAVNKKGEWQKMALETSLIPFRLYLMLTDKNGNEVTITSHSVMMDLGDGTTGVSVLEVNKSQNGDMLYDLQGRRVYEPKKGNLYIVNGKKVLF